MQIAKSKLTQSIFSKSLLLFYIFFALMSCNKSIIKDINIDTKKVKIKQQVDSIIKSGISKYSNEEQENFKKIQRFIDYEQYAEISFHDTASIVIISLNPAYNTTYNKRNLVASKLLVFVDHNNIVWSTYIYQFVPADNQANPKFPIDAVHHKYYFEDIDQDGKYSTYNSNGRLLDEIKVVGGKTIALAVATPKQNKSSVSESIIQPNCIDWYLTTFDQFGNIVDEEFLYTTCDGDGNNVGGGGGGGLQSTLAALTDWVIASSGTVWQIRSYEKLYGIRKQEPNPNEFTKIEHIRSEGFSQTSPTGQPYISYVELANNAYLNSASTATVQVYGKVTVSTGTQVQIYGSKSFSVSDFWP